MGHTTEDNAVLGEVELDVPDMFTSIMSVELVQNPHYAEVKKEADAWVAEYVYNRSNTVKLYRDF